MCGNMANCYNFFLYCISESFTELQFMVLFSNYLYEWLLTADIQNKILQLSFLLPKEEGFTNIFFVFSP